MEEAKPRNLPTLPHHPPLIHNPYIHNDCVHATYTYKAIILTHLPYHTQHTTRCRHIRHTCTRVYMYIPAIHMHMIIIIIIIINCANNVSLHLKTHLLLIIMRERKKTTKPNAMRKKQTKKKEKKMLYRFFLTPAEIYN